MCWLPRCTLKCNNSLVKILPILCGNTLQLAEFTKHLVMKANHPAVVMKIDANPERDGRSATKCTKNKTIVHGSQYPSFFREDHGSFSMFALSMQSDHQDAKSRKNDTLL